MSLSMFHPIRKFASDFVRISSNYSSKSIRKIAPGRIKTRPKKFEEPDYLKDPKIRRNLLEDVQNTGSMEMEEPTLEGFHKAYDDYNRDSERLKFKMKQDKMVRKHFSEYVEKEINLLTYAEKEHIRYLHNMDPGSWSPETIAESFPVSSEGAKKVLNSTFRVRSFEKAIAHDKAIAKKIKLIQEGVIKLTPDLERKMELRNKVPLQLGASQQYFNQLNTKALSVLPQKTPGEFESLVAHSQNISARNSTEPPFPYSSPSKEASEPERELYSQMPNNNNSNEFQSLKITPSRVMMLEELETKVSQSRDKKSKKGPSSSDPELDYLLSLEDKGLLKDRVSKESCDIWSPEEEYHPRTLVNKFQEPFHEDQSSRNQNQQYFTKTNTDELENGIEIPAELKRPGALYKVGNCFFDEDGQFLYRVI